MAHINSIWAFRDSAKDKKLTAIVDLYPAGQAQVEFELPEKFFEVLMACAQSAADHHEQQMKANILASEYENQKENE